MVNQKILSNSCNLNKYEYKLFDVSELQKRSCLGLISDTEIKNKAICKNHTKSQDQICKSGLMVYSACQRY